eukprot:gene2303-2756_t
MSTAADLRTDSLSQIRLPTATYREYLASVYTHLANAFHEIGWSEPFQTLPLYHRGSPAISTCLGNNSSFATLNNPEGVTDAVGDGSCAASLLPVGEKRAGALQASTLSLSLVAEDNDHTFQKSAEDVDVDLLKGGGSGPGRGRGLGPRTLTYGTSAP